jgi:hypothetical protein
VCSFVAPIRGPDIEQQLVLGKPIHDGVNVVTDHFTDLVVIPAKPISVPVQQLLTPLDNHNLVNVISVAHLLQKPT